MQEWPQIIRVSHLLGGCRAVSEPNGKLTLLPPAPEKGSSSCNLPSYQSFLPALTQEGLVPIGVKYYDFQEVADGLYPSTWISINPHNRKNTDTNIHTWRNIVNAAHENKDYKCIDITARISFQLKAIETRLRDISESYNRELNAIVNVGDFNEGCSTESRNTFQIGLSIHSFLADACTLRDYLAEYLSLYKYETADVVPFHSGLLKRVLKKIDKRDTLTDWIIRSSDTKSRGWLAQLSAYRDLAIHSVPLSYAGRKSMVFQRFIKYGGGELPTMFYPLPDDPIKIAYERSKNIQDSSYEDYWNRLYSIKSGIDQMFKLQDALEYCWLVNGYLSSYACECAKLSPYDPKIFEFNNSNILDIKIHK